MVTIFKIYFQFLLQKKDNSYVYYFNYYNEHIL